MKKINKEKMLLTITFTFTEPLLQYREALLRKDKNIMLGEHKIVQGESVFYLAFEKNKNDLYIKLIGIKGNAWVKGQLVLQYDNFFSSVSSYVKVPDDSLELEIVEFASQLTKEDLRSLFNRKRQVNHPKILKPSNQKKNTLPLKKEEFINRLLDGYNLNHYLHELTGDILYYKREKRILQFLNYFTTKTKEKN
ncbi:hypothetical protein CN918_31155 [Priestia megaterium]|nr:hypothetical protein CN918_31155 [Priestia megaterium]